MKKILSLLALAGVVAVTGSVIAGTKSLKIAGSTTVLPLSQIWAEAFMAKHPETSISVSGGGSGTGISMLLNGTVDIANASREAKSKEISEGRAQNKKLVATKIAKDGLAIIVHPSNNVKNLTMDQLNTIYSGKSDTWKEVGGESKGKIVAVGRDSSSGTYGFFQETVLGGGAYRKDMLGQASNNAVAQAVAQSTDAIGYVGMAYAEKFGKAGKVKIVSVSKKKGQPGMLPTDEMVKSGKYPLFRYLYCYTAGAPSGLAKQYLDFGLSPEGQKLVTKAGYLPLK
ncbi:MAG: phosphate ABC transporter substrate-binding protein [Armatimonadota bacterium]